VLVLASKLVIPTGLGAAFMSAALVGLAVAAGLVLPSSGEIAFISGRDGDYEIYLMDVGRHYTFQLTDNEVDDFYPAWSPDGCCLAFSSQPDAGSVRYIIQSLNLFTGETRQLTDMDNVSVLMPAWSPGGDQLVIAIAPGEQSRTSTCFLNIATSDRQCVADGFGASWSPDGASVASYVQDISGQLALRLINTTDFFDTRLVQNIATHVGVRPSWSPDGSQIAYTCNNDICVVNADGSEPRTLVNWNGTQYSADWSPDGRWLVLDSRSGRNFDVYLLDVESMAIRQLTDNAADDASPVWRPTGYNLP
jgi:Tol biopolymer transport system component